MHNLEDILKEKDYHSEQISKQVRMCALGLVIATWGFLIGDWGEGLSKELTFKTNLVRVGIVALLAMFCDFLQYLFGYLNNKALLNDMAKKSKEQTEYNYGDWRYILQNSFFKIKIALLVFAFFYLLIVVIPLL